MFVAAALLAAALGFTMALASFWKAQALAAQERARRAEALAAHLEERLDQAHDLLRASAQPTHFYAQQPVLVDDQQEYLYTEDGLVAVPVERERVEA